jgi:hypothetical protein
MAPGAVTVAATMCDLIYNLYTPVHTLSHLPQVLVVHSRRLNPEAKGGLHF